MPNSAESLRQEICITVYIYFGFNLNFMITIIFTITFWLRSHH